MQFQYFLYPEAAAPNEEDTVSSNTLAVNESESDQKSNQICNKKVNLFAFSQPLTVFDGIIFNYFYLVDHALIWNIAILKWLDFNVFKI